MSISIGSEFPVCSEGCGDTGGVTWGAERSGAAGVILTVSIIYLCEKNCMKKKIDEFFWKTNEHA